MARHAYGVHYKMHSADRTHLIDVVAGSKAEAYYIAAFEAIKAKEGSCPYSTWVSSVTYNNGKCRYFNTFEGNPY